MKTDLGRLAALLAPRSIALIGASQQAGRIGGLPLVHLTPHPQNTYNRYEGAVYPVNPKYPEIFGLPCHPDIGAVPAPVDLAIVALPAEQVMGQLEACHRAGVRAAIVFASGYAETGSEAGAARQRELQAFSARTGMPVAGPNCMGNANFLTGAYSTFAGAGLFAPPAGARAETAGIGAIGLLTQSGNMCAVLYKLGRSLGVRYSHFINTGNEATVDFSAYLAYLLAQPEVLGVTGYIEQLRDGPAFMEVARRYREQGRMLAVLKAGRTAKGSEAAFSHTSALSGSHSAFEAACREAGVIVAEDLPELALLGYLCRFPRRVGRRVGLVTMSGAAGALLSDHFTEGGFELPTLPPQLQQQLREWIPEFGMVSNPVDVTGNIQRADAAADSIYYRITKALLHCGDVDIVVLYMPGAYLDMMAADLVRAVSESERMLLVIDPSGGAKCVEALERAGIPYFGDLSRAARALVRYGSWYAQRLAPRPSTTDRAFAEVDVPALLCQHRATNLDEVHAKRLLAAGGVPVVAERVAHDAGSAVAAAAALGYPVALKVLSADIPHKSEAGGVKIRLASPDSVSAACDEILQNARAAHPDARIAGVVVQAMAGGVNAPGVELLVGITRDPVFGLLLTVGLGGVWTELFGDVAHALLPVDEVRADAMLRSLRGFALLDGFRGAPKADVAAATAAIARFAAFVQAGGERIAEAEINPLIVLPQGQGAVAVDALLKLAPQERG